jgi:hypothetical protein
MIYRTEIDGLRGISVLGVIFLSCRVQQHLWWLCWGGRIFCHFWLSYWWQNTQVIDLKNALTVQVFFEFQPRLGDAYV